MATIYTHPGGGASLRDPEVTVSRSGSDDRTIQMSTFDEEGDLAVVFLSEENTVDLINALLSTAGLPAGGV